MSVRSGDRAAQPGDSPSESAIQRWTSYMFQASTATMDLRTLNLWARHIGASYTTLAETCRLIGVRPQEAKDLARALSAAIQASRLQCSPTVLLNIYDSRTLKAFIRRAGSGFQPIHDSRGLDRLLESQLFVDPEHIGMRLLRNQIAEWLEDQSLPSNVS